MVDSFYTVYQVGLDAAAQDLLRTAGICGGDTLWILPSVPDEKKSSQSDRHSETGSASQILQPSQQSSQAAEQQSSHAAEQQSSLAAEQQTPEQVSASSQKMQEAHKADMQQLEQVRPVSVILFDRNKIQRHMTIILICSQSNFFLQAQQMPDIIISSAPDLLQRVLDSCTTALQSSHQLLLLTLHAVLLETGMQLTSQVMLTYMFASSAMY